jgi:hypothetical protein
MTKQTKPDGGALVPSSSGALPAVPDELLEITKHDAGDGLSHDPADQLLPLVVVLQQNSPQCNKRLPEHIDGAEAGRFWFRNDVIPIRDEFDCIRCGSEHVWLEWGPMRGSGLFGRYLQKPDNLVQRKSEENGRLEWIRPDNKHVIQETREAYLLIDGKPYVLSFHGSGHTIARQWESRLHQTLHPETKREMPAYSQVYHLSTFADSNSKGDWFSVKVDFSGFVQSREEYDRAKEFAQVIKRGTYRIEMNKSDS